MADRRFNEDEVAAIFRQATEEAPPAARAISAAGDGLTLAELQDIGRDIGIAPEVVARSAAAVDAMGAETTRRYIGLPIGVERTVNLRRHLTEDEWERLVVDLRETFGAVGAVYRTGSLREWANGNLHVLLEPAGAGDRVRFSTVNGSARAWMRAGRIALSIAAVIAVVAVVGGPAVAQLSWSVELAILAAGLFVSGAIRLPQWSRVRRRQIESLAKRLT